MMGLDIHVGRRGRSLHYSYGGFAQFRRRLAHQIGIDLDRMKGYGGRRSWARVDDPLVALLNHADCEDGLTNEQCGLVGPRLREIAAALGDPEADEEAKFGLELAEMMTACARRKLPLIFE